MVYLRSGKRKERTSLRFDIALYFGAPCSGKRGLMIRGGGSNGKSTTGGGSGDGTTGAGGIIGIGSITGY
jgi:hypothetical protein